MLPKKTPDIPSLESLKPLVDFNTCFNYTNKQDLLKKLDYLSKYLFKISLRSDIENKSFNSLCISYKNKKFIDNEFPPNLISLIGYHNTSDPKWSKIKWQRPEEYMQNYTIFPPEDSKLIIYRGVLNNSTFLSVISAFLEKPEIIKSLFLSKDINESGMYCVYICKDGKYKEYIIDDYFPCDNKKLIECFSHGEKNTIWLQILEKCYAKAYGSYSNIENNDLEKIIRDLAKAPLLSLDNSCEHLYLNFKNAQKNNYLIFACAGDTESGSELIKEIGLLPEYVYYISNIYTIDDNIIIPDESINPNNEQKIDDVNSNILLKIKNFWGKDGWLGDWSNGSMNWTENIKNKIGYDKSEKNCFYMNLKDFKHYFSKIVICHYHNNYEYKYISVIQKVESYSLVKMSIYSSGNNNKAHCFINLLQIINNKKTFLYEKYGIVRIIVCKLLKYNEKTTDYKIEFIDGIMKQDRDSFIEKMYEPGDYLIYTELSKNIIDTETIISTYSDSKIELEKIENNNYPKILEKIYISIAKKNQDKVYCYENEGAPNCFKYSDLFHIGYTYIYIENNEKDATLVENVNYTKFEGVKLVEPFSGTSYKVEVGPGQNQIVLIKQLNMTGFNLTLTFNNYFLFGEEALKNLAIKKGKHKKRKNPRINVELEINVYSYQHPRGLCFYYENNETNYSLEEKLKFNTMNGVEIVGEHDLEDEVTVIVKPKEKKFIQLKATKPNWTIQSKVSYWIKQV